MMDPSGPWDEHSSFATTNSEESIWDRIARQNYTKEEKHFYASKIQAIVRGGLARDRLRELVVVEYIIIIQSAVRGMLVRRRLARERENRRVMLIKAQRAREISWDEESLLSEVIKEEARLIAEEEAEVFKAEDKERRTILEKARRVVDEEKARRNSKREAKLIDQAKRIVEKGVNSKAKRTATVEVAKVLSKERARLREEYKTRNTVEQGKAYTLQEYMEEEDIDSSTSSVVSDIDDFLEQANETIQQSLVEERNYFSGGNILDNTQEDYYFQLVSSDDLKDLTGQCCQVATTTFMLNHDHISRLPIITEEDEVRTNFCIEKGDERKYQTENIELYEFEEEENSLISPSPLPEKLKPKKTDEEKPQYTEEELAFILAQEKNQRIRQVENRLPSERRKKITAKIRERSRKAALMSSKRISQSTQKAVFLNDSKNGTNAKFERENIDPNKKALIDTKDDVSKKVSELKKVFETNISDLNGQQENFVPKTRKTKKDKIMDGIEVKKEVIVQEVADKASSHQEEIIAPNNIYSDSIQSDNNSKKVVSSCEKIYLMVQQVKAKRQAIIKNEVKAKRQAIIKNENRSIDKALLVSDKTPLLKASQKEETYEEELEAFLTRRECPPIKIDTVSLRALNETQIEAESNGGLKPEEVFQILTQPTPVSPVSEHKLIATPNIESSPVNSQLSYIFGHSSTASSPQSLSNLSKFDFQLDEETAKGDRYNDSFDTIVKRQRQNDSFTSKTSKGDKYNDSFDDIVIKRQPSTDFALAMSSNSTPFTLRQSNFGSNEIDLRPSPQSVMDFIPFEKDNDPIGDKQTIVNSSFEQIKKGEGDIFGSKSLPVFQIAKRNSQL